MSTSAPSSKATRSPALYLLMIAAILLAAWLGLKSWRLLQVATSLQDRQAQIEQLLAEGFTNVDPQLAEQLVLDTRNDILVLRAELDPFMPIARHLGWLPRVGPLIEAAPALLEMADAGIEMAAYMVRGLRPGLELLQTPQTSSGSQIPALLGALDQAEPDLLQAQLAFARLKNARRDLADTSSLPWRIRELLDTADRWLPLADVYIKLAPVVPDMMGSQGTRRYLIVAQNEDEIRPTGGYISGAGSLTVANGQIVELTFLDAYQIDNWRDLPYDLPPQPLYDLMGAELFLFRDSNFWPDFPKSAQKMIDLYRYGQDSPPLDGVIAIDQSFARMLLEATGPIYIEEAGMTLDSQSVVDSFRQAWSFQGDPESAEWQEWYRNRKSFIGTFAVAVQKRIETEYESIDPLQMAQKMHLAAQGKHLQVYMTDPKLAAVLDDVNWDGRMTAEPHRDFLMAVDTNVGYTKSNVFIAHQLAYEVDIISGEQIRSSLTVRYLHQGAVQQAPCQQDYSYAFDVVSDYLNLANRCYWNYLRIYTPAGSRLLESTVHNVPTESLIAGSGWHGAARVVSETSAFSTFANYLLVGQGQQVDSTFQYQLPAGIIEQVGDDFQYRLLVAKQAGLSPLPTRVTITLPEGRRLIELSPQQVQLGGRRAVLEFDLEQDTLITLKYR